MLDIRDRFRNFRQRSLEPTQVEQLKTDLLDECTPLAKEMGRPFKLIFEVSQVE